MDGGRAGLTVMRLLLEIGKPFVEGRQVGGCVLQCRGDGAGWRRHTYKLKAIAIIKHEVVEIIADAGQQ